MIPMRACTPHLLLSICLLGAVLPVRALSESDRILLTMAKDACKNGDYRTFFDAFAKSPSVRQKYSAAKIQSAWLGTRGETLSKRDIDAASYTDFPVKLEDYYYKPRKPTRVGDVDEYLDLEFNQSQNNDISVEWSRIHYDRRSAVGDDLGIPLDAKGKSIPLGTHPQAEGQLLFRPTADCWVFSEDIRWQRRP